MQLCICWPPGQRSGILHTLTEYFSGSQYKESLELWTRQWVAVSWLNSDGLQQRLILVPNHNINFCAICLAMLCYAGWPEFGCQWVMGARDQGASEVAGEGPSQTFFVGSGSSVPLAQG